MEELLVNPDVESRILYTALNWLLLGGGLVAAGWLGFYLRNHRPDTSALTQEMIRRSWSSLQIALLLGSVFLLYFLAGFVGMFFYEEQIPLVKLLYTLMMYGMIMALIAWINHRRNGSWSGSGGPGLPRLKILYLTPILYLAFVPVLLLLTKGYHLMLESFSGSETELQSVAEIIRQEITWLQVFYMGVAVFVAPAYEELIFRGILFPYIVKRTGLLKGMLMLSLLFAGLHFHLPSMMPLFLLSMLLCAAYWRTGTLWLCIGIHTLFNAVSILSLHISG